MTKKITPTYLLLILALFGTSVFLNKRISKPIIKVNKQESALNLETSFYKIGFAGYKRLISDLLWITTLLESDTTHYKQNDFNNWMYLRFSSITSLDPKFLIAYQFAGQYLSVIKDDVKGAIKLLKQGLEVYPNDYQLNFTLGFVYALETEEYDKAAFHLERIQDMPQAPRFIRSIIGKLKYEATDNLDLAFNLNLELYETTEDEYLKAKLKGDLYSIKATKDLDCLNSNKGNCSKVDFLGNSYEIQDGVWRAKVPFKEYQLYLNRKESQE